MPKTNLELIVSGKSPSPYINRFLSADTIISSYTNPQNLNRFSYVGNNPLGYIDSTGHLPIDGPCGYQGQDCQNGPSTPPTTPSGGCGGAGQPSCLGNRNGNNRNDPEESPSSITINWNAVVDPFAWEHIALGFLGGVVLAGWGVVLIEISVDMCVGSVPWGGAGCVVGIPVGLAGVVVLWVSGKVIWSGTQFTKIYLNDIFEVNSPNNGDEK